VGILTLEQVSLHYPQGVEALKRVSFELKRGEFLTLVGPNGAGKTTLLKLVYMELLPSRGTVWVDGYSSRKIRPRQIPYLRRRLGIVPQGIQLLEDRDVFENVALALRVVGGKGMRKRAWQVLSQTGLGSRARSFPHQLSGGEAKRVVIARALVNQPILLLADEPTGGIDGGWAEGILSLLRRINGEGTTVLLATQDERIAHSLPGETLRIAEGRLI